MVPSNGNGNGNGKLKHEAVPAGKIANLLVDLRYEGMEEFLVAYKGVDGDSTREKRNEAALFLSML